MALSMGKPQAKAPSIFEKPSQDLPGKEATPVSSDPNLITWDDESDAENPKNWSQARKWLATLLMSCISLMTLMSSSMIAPALGVIARELHTGDAEANLALSAFVLAYAFAPMFFGPVSEIFGRIRVLQVANFWFLFWTIVCGFAHCEALLVVARLMSGVGGGAIFAIGEGFLGDCWRAHERGKSFAIYNAVPLLGPALGPVIGGYITDSIGWRWIFWIVAIIDAGVLFLSIIFLKETHERTILWRRMERIFASSGNDRLHTAWDTAHDDLHLRKPNKVLRTSSTRAFKMLGTQPILQVVALYQAFNYGSMFIVISTFSNVWTDYYHKTVAQSGLYYISLVVGSGTASLIGGPINDRIWAHLSRTHPRSDEMGMGVPEYRVPLMIPGAILVPIGLFWYGWSVQAHLHWIMPCTGIVVFFIGLTSSGQCMVAYLIDAYPERTASAIAAITLLRSILGFAFPLFAVSMYNHLGWGWGNSMLALASIVLGLPIPFILWFCGARLRQMSKCK